MKTINDALVWACCVIGFAVTCASADEGQWVVGSARFTAITPQCIRLEYQADGHFVDDPSYFASNRSAHLASATMTRDEKHVTIDTGAIRLVYTPDGKPFSDANLRGMIRDPQGEISWSPGATIKSNLGGTIRTLDGVDGAAKLDDGLLTRDGWYLLDDSKNPLFTSDWAKARPKEAGTDWYLFGYGHDYRAALRSLTAIGGSIPMPRRYTLGAWYSRYWPYTSQEFRQIVREYAEHGFPLDVLVIDMDWHKDGWTGYSWNPKLMADHQELLKWLHDQRLAVTLNEHPADGVKPHEDCYADFMRAMGKDPAKDAPLDFDAGDKTYLDAFFKHTHEPIEKEGVDFWWLDWQQYPNTRSIPSLTNLQWLNHYMYQRSTRDQRRGTIFSRWGGWGSHRYPIQFSGDATTAFKMLAFEVPFTSTAGNVGCFFWSHDIGGHANGRNEESYTRWCQFGAFTAALRSHSTRDPSLDRRPWLYPQWANDSMRKSFQLRSRFFPYTYSAVHQATAQSVPLVRPMYLDYPTTESAYHQPQQYFYGDDILVAPIAEPGAGPNRLGRQTVWFPGDLWYSFFTTESYTGPAQVLVACGIDEFPLFVRGGTPIPMRQVTHRMATDPLNELIVRCYPGADGQSRSTTLYEDDGITTGYQNGKCAQTKLSFSRDGNRYTLLIAPTEGEFEKQPTERSYVLELPATAKAESVLVDGVAAGVDYLEAESMNRVSVPARSIRKACQVVVQAAQISVDELSRRALAQRAGLAMPTRDLASSDLLARALETAKDHAHRTALLASVGIGVFSRNENVYGFPDERVEHLFGSDRFGAKVVATQSDQDPLSARTSQVYRVESAGRLLHQFTTFQPADFKTLPGNIASEAKIALSSGGPVSGLKDGVVRGYPDRMEQEWTSVAEKANAWASFAWNAPHKIDSVILFDRPNLDDQVLSGRIEFSDGTFTTFGELDNQASHGTEIKFDPRTITTMKIVLDTVGPKTVNIGLSEVVVHECK